MPRNLRLVQFANIDLGDSFFDSLKADYKDFEQWFRKKANEFAYILENDDGSVNSFLYLKVEEGAVTDVEPELPPARRAKVGTLKVNPHGTRLGERFVKKIFDYALNQNVEEVYVTVFSKHEALVNLFLKYGFIHTSSKHTKNGTELVMVRRIHNSVGNIVTDYPLIHTQNAQKYLLAIYPGFHTRLLPDSILNNENINIVQDVSHTNSIHKIYICFMDVSRLRRGDVLIIYRTTDEQGPAHYRSVVTSVCIVEEVKDRRSFPTANDFVRYCESYSVFSNDELRQWYNRPGRLFAIKFTYNAAFERRTTRGMLIEDVGLSAKAYWGFMRLSEEQFRSIIHLGRVNESIIID